MEATFSIFLILPNKLGWPSTSRKWAERLHYWLVTHTHRRGSIQLSAINSTQAHSPLHQQKQKLYITNLVYSILMHILKPNYTSYIKRPKLKNPSRSLWLSCRWFLYQLITIHLKCLCAGLFKLNCTFINCTLFMGSNKPLPKGKQLIKVCWMYKVASAFFIVFLLCSLSLRESNLFLQWPGLTFFTRLQHSFFLFFLASQPCVSFEINSK